MRFNPGFSTATDQCHLDQYPIFKKTFQHSAVTKNLEIWLDYYCRLAFSSNMIASISMHLLRYARNSKFFIGFVDSLLSQPCKYETGYLADKAGPKTTDRELSILGSCFTGGAIFHWPNAFEFHISEPTSNIKPFSRLGCLLLALKDCIL